MVLYEYINSLMNDVNNLFDNTHHIIIYVSGVLCGIIYIANDGHHVRILHNQNVPIGGVVSIGEVIYMCSYTSLFSWGCNENIMT